MGRVAVGLEDQAPWGGVWRCMQWGRPPWGCRLGASTMSRASVTSFRAACGLFRSTPRQDAEELQKPQQDRSQPQAPLRKGALFAFLAVAQGEECGVPNNAVSTSRFFKLLDFSRAYTQRVVKRRRRSFALGASTFATELPACPRGFLEAHPTECCLPHNLFSICDVCLDIG